MAVVEIVSNTQVSTENLCERQHDYRFVKNIEPAYIPINTPLGTGLLGHKAFEAYYLEILDGGSIDTAFKAADQVLQQELIRLAKKEPEQFEQAIRVAHLKNLFSAYSEYYRQDSFKVLAVEKVFTTPISDGIEYGMKIDLLVEYTKGEHRGEVAVWDHKFVYNFKSPVQIKMDSQQPKYTKTLRDNGYPVYHAVFNQLRYREIKNATMTQLFKRDPLKSTKIEIDTIWKEQAQTALKIVQGNPNPVRTQHILTCEHCYFEGLCKADLMGLDTTQMIKTEFKPSTYGYTDFMSNGDVFS